MYEKIILAPVAREHVREIVNLLQSISIYLPPDGQYDDVWIEFSGQSHVRALVAFIGERLVGYGSVSFETRIRGGKVGHVEDVVCSPEFMGRGVGKAIVDALSKLAFEQGCFKLSLQCEDNNVSFYRKCSFRESGISMQRFRGDL